jgi:hypothetical protein
MEMIAGRHCPEANRGRWLMGQGMMGQGLAAGRLFPGRADGAGSWGGRGLWGGGCGAALSGLG